MDFSYFKENYKLIRIDLSKQTKLKDPQQFNFIGKLENQNHGATMFFIIKKSEETTFNFSQNSITIIYIMETQEIIDFLNDSTMKIQNLQQKNCILLTVKKKVVT